MRYYPHTHCPRAMIGMILLILLAICPASFARSTFDEFESAKSPEIARQACGLARWAVGCRLKGVDTKKPPMKLHRIFTRRAGVFVTMTKDDNPRGCMGTVEPMHSTVAQEIIENAIAAATADRRHRPLAPEEISRVTFHVAIVGPLRPIRGRSDLRPNTLGLLVRSGSRMGILLPGEAKTASWQLKECKRKAALPPDAPVQMYTFRTVALDEVGDSRVGLWR